MIITPLKRNGDGICESHVLPFVGKHHAKKPSCMQQAHNVDARILFSEVSEIHVVEGHSKTIKELTKEPEDVVFVKEVNVKDKLNKEVFMSDSSDYSYVEKCFSGAASMLVLPLCDTLFFHVLFGKHWFLFVVDLKNKMFIFLDSYYSKNDDFCVYTRNKLKKSFCHAWAKYVGLDPGFNNFRTCYAHVPKQANKVDCGIFTIKFMEVWKLGCNMLEVFSQEDIPNIRVQIVNDLLFSKNNSADVNVVKNFNAIGSVR